MRAIYLLVPLAAPPTCLIEISSHSGGDDRPRREEGADPKPALIRQPDLDVIDGVLNEMLKDRLNCPFPVRVRDKGTIVVSVKGRPITDKEIVRHFGDEDRRLIPREIREDFARRNQKVPMSLELLKPSNTRLVVADLSHLLPPCDLRKAHAGAHGWGRFWDPATAQMASLRLSSSPAV